jgi:hypothetical protein
MKEAFSAGVIIAVALRAHATSGMHQSNTGYRDQNAQ